MSIKAYQQAQDRAESPRAIEQRALGLVTGRLRDAREKGGRDMIEACYDNQRLWNVFQADLAHPDNGLPDDLKARLISLAIWVQRHTTQVIRNGASVDALIDVNVAIMEGLAATPAKPAPQAAAVTPTTVRG